MRLGFSVDIIYNMTTEQRLAKLFFLSPLVTNSLDSEKFPKVLKVRSYSNSQALCSVQMTGLFSSLLSLGRILVLNRWYTGIPGVFRVCHLR